MSLNLKLVSHSKSQSQSNLNEPTKPSSLYNLYRSSIIQSKKKTRNLKKNKCLDLQTESNNFLSVGNRIFDNRLNRNKISIKLQNSQFCPLEVNCPYYRMCVMFEVEINKLMETNDHLTQMCQIYLNGINQKEKLYKNMMNESEKIINKLTKEKKKFTEKKVCNTFSEPILNITSNINNSNNNNNNNNNDYDKKNELEQKKIKSMSSIKENNINNTNNNKEFSNIELIGFSNAKSHFFSAFSKIGNDSPTSPTRRPKIKRILKSNSILPNGNNNNNINVKEIKTPKRNSLLLKNLSTNKINRKYYDAISTYTKNSRNISIQNQTHQSFLSFQYDFSNIFEKNPFINQLDQITKNDNEFIDTMTNADADLLISYSDSISYLLKNYKDMVNVNLRMKDFLKSSINLVESILNNNSYSVLLKNTCDILDCERTSLFILDKNTDMLIVHSGEGLKKGSIKIPKDKGIVGSCFMSKKKLRIDEVYFDNRFDKEFDKKNNFRTKNILCFPLIDIDNECFGVIEAINKNNLKNFDSDDEELLRFFSLYASSILKNAINVNENSFQISRVELLLYYSIEIQKIQKLEIFINKTRDLLFNLFSCVYAEIFLCENDQIYKLNDKGEKQFYNKNLGCVGLVYRKKEIYECSNTQNSVYYNDLIDMDSTNGLLTFPIIYGEFFKGIIQVPFHSKPNSDGKPKNTEIYIINLFNQCFIQWCHVHI